MLFGHQEIITDSASETSTDIKTSRWRCAEQQDIYTISSVSYIVIDYKKNGKIRVLVLKGWGAGRGQGETSPSRGHLVKSADTVVVPTRVCYWHLVGRSQR